MKILLLLLCSVATTLAQTTTENISALVDQLRQGGHVIFIRHPKTDPDQADTNPLQIDDVLNQRHLTNEGRQQARDLGAAFRDLGIPVGRVISSQFYRAKEAATLLALGKVESLVDVTEGGLVVSPNENKRRAEALRKLLSTPPEKGKNTIIVSHRPNLLDAAGKEFADLGEAEAVVFKPNAGGAYDVIARVFLSKHWNPATVRK